MNKNSTGSGSCSGNEKPFFSYFAGFTPQETVNGANTEGGFAPQKTVDYAHTAGEFVPCDTLNNGGTSDDPVSLSGEEISGQKGEIHRISVPGNPGAFRFSENSAGRVFKALFADNYTLLEEKNSDHSGYTNCEYSWLLCCDSSGYEYILEVFGSKDDAGILPLLSRSELHGLSVARQSGINGKEYYILSRYFHPLTVKVLSGPDGKPDNTALIRCFRTLSDTLTQLRISHNISCSEICLNNIRSGSNGEPVLAFMKDTAVKRSVHLNSSRDITAAMKAVFPCILCLFSKTEYTVKIGRNNSIPDLPDGLPYWTYILMEELYRPHPNLKCINEILNNAGKPYMMRRRFEELFETTDSISGTKTLRANSYRANKL